VTTDWLAWHDAYDDPASGLSHRLARVQNRVAQALDAQPPGPVSVLSMCAGRGSDLLDPLARWPRRQDVTALLVETDPRLAADAAARAADAALAGVRVVVADAGETGVYAPVVPVGLALVCGVFGNVPDADVERIVATLPALLAPGATVIWTRTRAEPDLTPRVRAWFADQGFAELGFDTEDGYDYAVGTHVLRAEPARYRPGVRMFRFV
jgi:hypothetical protein